MVTIHFIYSRYDNILINLITHTHRREVESFLGFSGSVNCEEKIFLSHLWEV